MKHVGTSQLLSIPEVARRLDITNDAAFDLAFVTRELPLEFRAAEHGVPEDAVEEYLNARSGS